MTETARVILWGSDIGAVTWVAERGRAVFQYTPEFITSGIQPAPAMMPLQSTPIEFPSLSFESFKGLPGMLADSLPDRFGNALIDTWLASQGRATNSFTPVERLCYVGTRGIGALEFKPSLRRVGGKVAKVEIDRLVALANQVLDQRIALKGTLAGADDHDALENILRVGTSAGGARAKAVLCWNESTGEFRSGQSAAPEGFDHWLLKFDGIQGNRDKELADPQGFGRIEYAYSLMAKVAGIHMADCRLHEEGGRAHFMTKRFDRTTGGDKLHMQSLGALMHYDFNRAGAYGYEQAVQAIRVLSGDHRNIEEQYRRTCFNIMARNQDDHVKNIAFLMNRRGEWRLSPAFDVTYAYNPTGDWTGQHQMSLNGKRDGFTSDDLLVFAKSSGVKSAKAKAIVEEISEALKRWPEFAGMAGVGEQSMGSIRKLFRSRLFL